MKDSLRILMAPYSETDAPELANGDPPSYIRKMDRRLIVLETRFDTILPTLATKTDLIGMKSELKADIEELRAETRSLHGESRAEMRDLIAKLQQQSTNMVIAVVVGFGGLIVTLVTVFTTGLNGSLLSGGTNHGDDGNQGGCLRTAR